VLLQQRDRRLQVGERRTPHRGAPFFILRIDSFSGHILRKPQHRFVQTRVRRQVERRLALEVPHVRITPPSPELFTCLSVRCEEERSLPNAICYVHIGLALNKILDRLGGAIEDCHVERRYSFTIRSVRICFEAEKRGNDIRTLCLHSARQWTGRAGESVDVRTLYYCSLDIRRLPLPIDTCFHEERYVHLDNEIALQLAELPDRRGVLAF
jgi:hypothetical protein